MATSLALLNEADDLITCAVCFEKYNHGDRLPKYLLCLHTFCRNCLGKLMLESFTMNICCPNCRHVTSTDGSANLTCLRTNEHALRIIQLEDRISSFDRSSAGISAWCHTCDELASNSCNRHVLTQLSRNDELLLSRNQMDKIKLSLSYAVSRRTEIDSYLKSIKQSFTILEKHVIQLMEDNSLQMDFIEGILEELDCETGKSLPRQLNYGSCLEDDAESAYISALALAQTFEGAKDWVVSVHLEAPSGKSVPALPHLNQMKLNLSNQISGKAVNTAGLNTLSFVLLLQLQEQIILANKFSETTATAESIELPVLGDRSSSSPTIQSLFPQLTVHYCFVDVELYNDRARLLFQLIPDWASEFCQIFLRCFQINGNNYLQSVVVKAAISLFVMFGSPYQNRSYGPSQPSYSGRELISQQGDVGLYYNSSQPNALSDFIILLAPFSDRNVRRAPVVAYLIEGLDFCHQLSHLKLSERKEARIINCGII